MWTEKQKNGKYKYVERYINPHTGEEIKLSLTHEKNTKTVEKEMIIALQKKFIKRLANIKWRLILASAS